MPRKIMATESVMIPKAVVTLVILAASLSMRAQTVVRHLTPSPKSLHADGVWAGDTLYVAGQLATPTTPADPVKGTPAIYSGDTEAQTFSALKKIQVILQEQGLDMKDVVKMTAFIVGDPATGKLDFAGMQRAYTQFFGSKEQPEKPARSVVQVAGIAAQGSLVQIEVIAVKSK
jgi:enamine deaminase RidA (YjgF/YER057c/UK114 family)